MSTTQHQQAALEAAYALADLCEWKAAGLMLRASTIPSPTVALVFALEARADCMAGASRDRCTTVIRLIDAGTVDHQTRKHEDRK